VYSLKNQGSVSGRRSKFAFASTSKPARWLTDFLSSRSTASTERRLFVHSFTCLSFFYVVFRLFDDDL